MLDMGGLEYLCAELSQEDGFTKELYKLLNQVEARRISNEKEKDR